MLGRGNFEYIWMARGVLRYEYILDMRYEQSSVCSW